MQHEWTRYFRYPEWHDLEALHARFVDHCFSRHAHDYFVIGYVESGVQAYTYRGGRHCTPAGQIFFVNPGEIHTGEAATPHGYVYRTMYPRVQLLEQVSEDIGAPASVPFLRDAVVRDQILARRLRAFHSALARNESRVMIESLLFSALACLLMRHADPQPHFRAAGKERDYVRRGRDYMESHCGEDVSLSQLAAVVGLSPFYFARSFAKHTGIPPHIYLEAVRIRKARELLDQRMPIAEVSLAVGYSDQSHFTNRFKRALGITPGEYLRGRTF